MLIVKGQAEGLEKMISKERYCVDIITQSSAMRSALSSIEDILLENHLLTHTTMQMRSGLKKKAATEILRVHRLSKKR